VLILARALPYLATAPGALVAFYLVFVVFLLSEWRISRRRPTEGAQNRDRSSRLAVFAGSGLAYGAAFGVSFTVPSTLITQGQPLVFALGLVIAVAGQGLRLWAVRVLGSSFTYTVHTAAGQTVIDRGPYRLIRHPSYTGGFLFALGTTIALTDWLAPLMTVFLAAGYVVRIRVEERALTDALGEPYRAYMRRTKRLIPFLL